MNPCSWCNEERGIVDPPGTSHGICARHKAAMLAEISKPVKPHSYSGEEPAPAFAGRGVISPTNQTL